ncbi:hypothetical protein CC86DRAFT_301888, partial [Ophiobolus disseminans]
TSGTDRLQQYDHRDTSIGQVVRYWLCTNCGSPMWTKSRRLPGVAASQVA